MVQWLANPSTHAQRTTTIPRDALFPKRPARRGYSVTDFQGDAVPFDILATLQAVSLGTTTTTTPATPATPSPSSSSSSSAAAHVPTEASIPENAVLLTSSSTAALSSSSAAAAARRPELKNKKPPRRSYSATDKEPEDVVLAPNQPRPSPHAVPGVVGLLDLPPELHYALLDFLDPIDAVCLGLAHRQLYTIHRRKNSRVPLSSRYHGPNDLEWVWRGVRHHLNQRGSGSSSSSSSRHRALEEKKTTSSSSSSRDDGPPAASAIAAPLDKLRVKGQVYCRKCGIARCELHRHIRSWMGDGYQYCEITERFGRPAPDGAKSYCFMSSPKDRRRCGRHSALKAGGGSSSSPSTTPATTSPAADAPTTTPPWA